MMDCQLEDRKSAISPPQFATVLSGVRGAVTFDAPLAELTSLRIGGPADALIVPEDVSDVRRIVRQAAIARLPLMVLGGTNLLVKDGGVRGLVLSMSKLAAVTREDERIVFAEAGVRLPTLLGYAVSQSLSGLEWAVGIPGTLGGAVVMNAGTKLGDVQNCLDAVQMVTPEGHVRTCAAADLAFSYRRVDLPEGVVVGARLRLTPASKNTLKPARRHTCSIESIRNPYRNPMPGPSSKTRPAPRPGV